MATGDFIDMRMTLHKDDVDDLLDRMDRTIDPVALGVFLETRVEPYIRSRAQSRFNTEGDDVTGPWAPLAQATQEIRAQSGYGPAHPINKRTGQLEDYIVNSPYGVRVDLAVGASLIAPGESPTGELLKKMKRAQAGDSRTPARPVIGVNEQDLMWVMLNLAEHVVGGVY